MTDLRVKSRGMVQDSAKLLLRNVIRHTDTHNRLAEEAEMWNVYQKIQGRSQDNEGNRSDTSGSGQKRKRDRDRHQSDHSFRDPDVKNSFLYDDRQVVRGHNSTGRHSKGRAHMDFYDSDTDRSSDIPSGKSTFWMRQLENAEAADQDRWGHAGYKELYPHDFKSDRSGSDSSSQEDSDDNSNVRRKKKRKSHPSSSDKRRLKKKKEKKAKADKKKHNSDDWRECDAIKKKLKKKRKRYRGEDDSDADRKQMKRSKKDDKESHRKKRRK